MLVSEILFFFIPVLKYWRGVIYLCGLLYITKDAYYVFFIQYKNDEPIYGATMIHTLAFLISISVYYWYSWISSFWIYIAAAIFFSIYDIALY